MSDHLEARVLGVLKKQKRTALSLRELCKRAGIRKNNREELLTVLKRLTETGKLVEENGKYLYTDNLGLVPGEIIKVNATFGFARPEGSDRDAFIPGRMLMGAMPGDHVLLRIKKRGSGELPEAEVYKIQQESNPNFSGVLELDDYECRILPDRYVRFPVRLSRQSVKGLKDGDKIVAKIEARAARHSEHMAVVREGFGSAGKASACCASILAVNDICPDFPDDVLEQAKAVGAGEGIHPKELAVRLDLRDELIFTIDGADTKDIDDAVSLEKNEKGWLLGVHIADVSYYVTYKTPLDKEAFVRGTSVYFADSVIPMLPKELSNGICSLNPGEDRLAFSVFIQLDRNGKIEDYRFQKTAIRSRIKGVYHEINGILAGKAEPELLKKYTEILPILPLMDELAKILAKNRLNRGGVNLNSVESKIIVDENDCAVDVKPRETGAAEGIIEEFMLTANEAAARLAIKEKLPFVYRVHENPSPDKLAALYEVLHQLGISFQAPKGKISSDQLAAILEKVRGTDVESVINAMMLRSMAKAKYSDQNIGHFGLALDDYTHFTSPIRRYPDLTVHRVLSAFITGMKRENINKRFQTFAGQAASQSSRRELAAMTAERDCESCYKAEYMQKHIGEEYDGVIASVTQFGCYVRLANTVEGLARIESLASGDWQFDGGITLVDTISGKKLRVGQSVRVKVVSADVSAGQVDFEII